VRGGGRSSYRSTISDVIGGSIARLYLAQQFGAAFFSSIVQVGPLQASRTLGDFLTQKFEQRETWQLTAEELVALEEELAAAEVYTLDADFARQAAALIQQARREGDSLGAMVEVAAVNVPPLLGDPLYQSLKLRLMGALGGLHAAQSCEIGDGLTVVSRRGSENNDPIRRSGYQRNSHGGLIGGMTTGAPLVFRVGFKPTSTIAKAQLSVRKNLEEIEFQLQKGRHDPCVGVRAGVTLESRMAIEVMNAVLMQQSAGGRFELF
jgi:chorismate synthase